MSVCIFCIQIYIFTPILINFVHLIYKTRRKLLSTLILQKPTPTTIFNPVKKKRQFFRVGNTLTYAASPLFHPLSISSNVDEFLPAQFTPQVVGTWLLSVDELLPLIVAGLRTAAGIFLHF
jgi:hypothetical protein